MPYVWPEINKNMRVNLKNYLQINVIYAMYFHRPVKANDLGSVGVYKEPALEKI